MLGFMNNFKMLTLMENTSSKLINYQTVRWRKPIWLPQAKSKMFKIPVRKVIPEEEVAETIRLFDIYRTQVKSIRIYLIKKYQSTYEVSADPVEQHKAFEEDFVKSVEINNKWNAEQKLLREKRVAAVLESELAYARKRIEDEIIKEEEKLERMEEIVRNVKEEVKYFITPDKLDEAIDRALANPVDYNYAIDMNGEKIIGRESIPTDKQKISVAQ